MGSLSKNQLGLVVLALLIPCAAEAALIRYDFTGVRELGADAGLVGTGFLIYDSEITTDSSSPGDPTHASYIQDSCGACVFFLEIPGATETVQVFDHHTSFIQVASNRCDSVGCWDMFYAASFPSSGEPSPFVLNLWAPPGTLGSLAPPDETLTLADFSLLPPIGDGAGTKAQGNIFYTGPTLHDRFRVTSFEGRVVPEPGSCVLLLFGLAAAVTVRCLRCPVDV